MNNLLLKLKEILAEVSDLKRAANVLSWDQQVNLPPAGAEARSHQLSTLTKLAHTRFTSAETGELLDALSTHLKHDDTSEDALLIREIKRKYEKQTRIPSAWVAEFTRSSALAQQSWLEAKAENKFLIFRPHLETLVNLIKEYADFFSPYEHPYDTLLDNYEPGLTTSIVKSIFNELRPKQTALIKAISEKPTIEDNFLYQPFDENKQWDFSVKVLSEIGFYWSGGCMHRSEHPFTIEFGHGDVRITTHLYPQAFNPGFFAALHEGGHALYEQGIAKNLYRTLLDEGASMAMHESQSRLWENFIGRSLPFWQHYFPILQQYFPNELIDVSTEDFYKAINKVQPTPIRIEADEATYNLHIMLRFDLEVGLLQGTYSVKDLPSLWRNKMLEYIGILPPNDTQGVLQDIHWSEGLFGYFPTYALGNVIAAQLWQSVQNDIPNINDEIQQGNFTGLLKWLRNKIHRYGALLQPQPLLKQAIGQSLQAAPYLAYLENKFSDIYHL